MIRFTPLLLLLMIPACDGPPPGKSELPPQTRGVRQTPIHDRAEAAALRVRPGLRRDLQALGLRFGDPVFLRAFKEEKQLELWVRRRDSGKYELFRTWPIAARTTRSRLRRRRGRAPDAASVSIRTTPRV